MQNQNSIQGKFIEKEFQEVPGGYFDEHNFYFSPNGSFWDPDGYYFNRQGFDKHGGFYDENLEYNPGESWDEENECYNSDRGSDQNYQQQEKQGHQELNEEEEFKNFRYGAIFDEEDCEDNEDEDCFDNDFGKNRNHKDLEKLYENDDLSDEDIFLGNAQIKSNSYKFSSNSNKDMRNNSNYQFSSINDNSKTYNQKNTNLRKKEDIYNCNNNYQIPKDYSNMISANTQSTSAEELDYNINNIKSHLVYSSNNQFSNFEIENKNKNYIIPNTNANNRIDLKKKINDHENVSDFFSNKNNKNSTNTNYYNKSQNNNTKYNRIKQNIADDIIQKQRKYVKYNFLDEFNQGETTANLDNANNIHKIPKSENQSNQLNDDNNINNNKINYEELLLKEKDYINLPFNSNLQNKSLHVVDNINGNDTNHCSSTRCNNENNTVTEDRKPVINFNLDALKNITFNKNAKPYVKKLQNNNEIANPDNSGN